MSAFSYDSLNTLFPYLFALFLGIVVYGIASLLPKHLNKVFIGLMLFIVTFYFCAQLCVSSLFTFFIDLGTIGLANQIPAFMGEAISLIIENLVNIIIFFVPLIIYCLKIREFEIGFIFSKKVDTLLCVFIIFLCFIAPREELATETSIKNFGIIFTSVNDLKAREEVEFVAEEVEEEVIEEVVVEEKKEILPHILNIDFEAAQSNNKTIQKLNDYFSKLSPTTTNEYTGIFEGKNLILILGESFNSLGIREDLTPTLYKMMNEGFEFTNYFSPSYNSTVGGEFQLLNSAFAKSDILGIWKSGNNGFPFSIANNFKDLGYSLYAYHDNAYDYMDRNKYLKGYGFDNYQGCWNGLEKKMHCGGWPESDEDMMIGTTNDWINEEKFLTYYVTVSGHGPYTLDRNRSDMGIKYYDYVKSLGYTYNNKILCYLSSMVELDKAMEHLITSLEEAGKLEDTVICLVGDHYPYFLDEIDYGELYYSGYDMKIDACRNNLLIYNVGTEKISSNKACATMDVIPTLYNLFNISYDSRLFGGRDIFSKQEGLVIFGDGSWVSDGGRYYAGGRFVPNEGVELSDDYFDRQNKRATTRMALTSEIFTTNYYEYISNFIN